MVSGVCASPGAGVLSPAEGALDRRDSVTYPLRVPSTLHIDVDPDLKGWLGAKGKAMRLSVNGVVKVILYRVWEREERAKRKREKR